MLFKWRFEQCPSNVDGVCTLRQRGSGIKKKDSRPLLFEDKSEHTSTCLCLQCREIASSARVC